MQKLEIATFILFEQKWILFGFFFNYLSNYVMETFGFSLFGKI
jgi:hypothetical protein